MSSSSLEVYNKSVYAFAINHIKNMIVSVKRWNSSFQSYSLSRNVMNQFMLQ
ncbi:hypothetical protein AALP_AAs52445U000100, partial [Arabis alpina]